MKVLLCFVQNYSDLRMKSILASYPPLGVGYLARYLLKDGHEVRIFINSHRNPLHEQFQYLLKDYAPDVVGFTVYTYTVNISLSLARLVKVICPASKVVFGGVHASFLPYETLSNDCVDIIVAGEGEETMTECVAALTEKTSLKGIRGIIYKDNHEIIDNGPRELITDLDILPFPAYDLMNMGGFCQSITRGSSGKKFGTIITSRGCPYACTFCSNKMFGKKVRFRSAENIVDEIELLVKRFGINELMFVDDTFTIDKKRVIAICELMLRRGLDCVWTCNTRADHASREIYTIMKKAGCESVLIGVEAGSQEMLDSMKKGITVEQVENAVSLAKKYIGHVICTFIFGMPGDTLNKARKTIEFAKQLNPDYAFFNLACPLPGSEIFEEEVRKGNIDKRNANWDSFSFFHAGISTVEMSAIKREDFVMLVKKAFREFYFRPGYILGRLRKIKSFRDIFQYLRGLTSIFSYECAKFSK